MADTKKVNPGDCDCSNACTYKVPIKLYVPIILDLEVFAKTPICHPQGVLPVRAASESESDAAAPEAAPAPESSAAA
jgi:hypothetical protein